MANPKSAADTPISPVAFTRAFQRYRNDAAQIPFADTRLLLAARFWGEYPQALGADAFATYWREDLPQLLVGLDIPALADLSAEEIEEVAAFVGRTAALLADIFKSQDSPAPAIWELAARQWLYLGQVERAFVALMKMGSFAVPSEEETATVLEAAGSCGADELPEFLAERLNDNYGGLAGWLRSFGSSWKIGIDSGYHDCAHCLLVEYDPNGRPVRGRLRRLTAKIEERRKGADTDEVIFHHQLKSPDDPFVGMVYNALTALRRHRGGRRMTPDGRYLRGRFEITGDGSETYGGNSIGLAAFAGAYGSWWNGEIHRERQLIGHSVAFTGALDDTGEIQPIAEESLALKVERAFRSPLTYLVVPESNRKTAEQIAQTLRERYPRRRLHIIGVERISDIITDHNILRPEKVCPAEFVYRKAGKYSRSVKVQAPLLMALFYALICVIEPRAWILFNWNPHSVKVTTDGFKVLNRNGQKIRHQIFNCECDTFISQWAVGDLDSDGRNEVAYMPKASETSLCRENANLFVYDDDGDLLFRLPSVILEEYPGDTILDQQYSPSLVDFITLGNRKLIITAVTKSLPARAHIRFWTAAGDSLGWFINQGFVGGRRRHVVFKNRGLICMFGYNNKMGGSAALWVLSPDSCYGVSPPYNFGECRRGNQHHYLVFPRTDLSLEHRCPYSEPEYLTMQANGEIEVLTREFNNPITGCISTSTLHSAPPKSSMMTSFPPNAKNWSIRADFLPSIGPHTPQHYWKM